MTSGLFLHVGTATTVGKNMSIHTKQNDVNVIVDYDIKTMMWNLQNILIEVSAIWFHPLMRSFWEFYWR